MKKKIQVHTDAGIFTGEIVVSLNSRKETRDVHNSILHEEVPNTFVWHKVESFLPDGRVYHSRETLSDEEVLELAKKLEVDLRSYLIYWSHKPDKAVHVRLRDMGFMD